MSLYGILGVSRDAPKAVIKQAYKRLAMAHHPDRGGDVETFKQIQTAYDVLSDPERRAHYDATGSADKPLSPEEEAAKNRRARSLQTLRKVFAQALTSQDEKTVDLLEGARKVLAEAHRKVLESVTEMRRRRDKAVEAASRVTDEESVLAPLLQSLADEASAVAAQGEEEMLMVDLAVAILESGTYRVDAPTPEQEEAEMMALNKLLMEQMREQMIKQYGGRAKFNFGT